MSVKLNLVSFSLNTSCYDNDLPKALTKLHINSTIIFDALDRLKNTLKLIRGGYKRNNVWPFINQSTEKQGPRAPNCGTGPNSLHAHKNKDNVQKNTNSSFFSTDVTKRHF